MTTALLADSAVIDYRDALELLGLAPHAAAGLLVEGLRTIRRGDPNQARQHERPGSAFWHHAVADDDLAPGLVLHLRIGDAGDLDLLADRALVVVGLRFQVVE